MVASTPPSPPPYLPLLPQADKQTQTHKAKQHFLIKKKSNKERRSKKTRCASLGHCKGNTAQSLHSTKALGRSRVQGQNLPQPPGHIPLGCLRTVPSLTLTLSFGMWTGRLKLTTPQAPSRECIHQAISPPNPHVKKVFWMLSCTFCHKEG